MSAGEHSDDGNRVLIHDFRNLLAVIVNYCELIAEETGDPEAVQAPTSRRFASPPSARSR